MQTHHTALAGAQGLSLGPVSDQVAAATARFAAGYGFGLAGAAWRAAAVAADALPRHRGDFSAAHGITVVT
jgi:hypothetical protein